MSVFLVTVCSRRIGKSNTLKSCSMTSGSIAPMHFVLAVVVRNSAGADKIVSLANKYNRSYLTALKSSMKVVRGNTIKLLYHSSGLNSTAFIIRAFDSIVVLHSFYCICRPKILSCPLLDYCKQCWHTKCISTIELDIILQDFRVFEFPICLL